MKLRLWRGGQQMILASDSVERVVSAREVVLTETGMDGLWLAIAGGHSVLAQEPMLGAEVSNAAKALVLLRANGDMRQALLADRLDWVSDD
ncbi:MAG: hypothetical protein EBT03_05785 [Betaproteobacteria bacterium]|nr:hypothetical protein [Betaproteobacteria bacterium]NBT74848.1 hypothetical protein [Betaproteobacteria bacterium]NBY13594.1 hypothetical protein [Betaproteobacteria bacterium]NCA16866.1 hypothetical protein [Betaproteobacteria bacterium]